LQNNKQHFRRCGGRAVALSRTTKVLGIAKIKPVCRLIEGAMKARRIDEGFYQQQGMAKVRRTIASDRVRGFLMPDLDNANSAGSKNGCCWSVN